ncbi:MAG: 30S ribosomal protein S4, partial [Candidatus Omnitrophota bacterium]
GQHGQRRRSKLSGYAIQLREKQKVKRLYGILEKQFRLYFEKAESQKGITGENLLTLLERRLDNVVFRACFSASRNEARQMVKHGFFSVNGKKVDIPSYLVKTNDIVAVHSTKEAKQKKKLSEAIEVNKDRGIPKWIKLEDKELKVIIQDMPKREDVGFPIEEQHIVELYSK